MPRLGGGKTTTHPIQKMNGFGKMGMAMEFLNAIILMETGTWSQTLLLRTAVPLMQMDNGLKTDRSKPKGLFQLRSHLSPALREPYIRLLNSR